MFGENEVCVFPSNKLQPLDKKVRFDIVEADMKFKKRKRDTRRSELIMVKKKMKDFLLDITANKVERLIQRKITFNQSPSYIEQEMSVQEVTKRDYLKPVIRDKELRKEAREKQLLEEAE